MIYESIEEQERIESIIARLEVINEGKETTKLVAYDQCSVSETPKFSKVFKEDSGDIVTLVAIYLYCIKDTASQQQQFRYTFKDGKQQDFIVVKDGDIALFKLPDE